METPSKQSKWRKRSQNYTGGNAIAGNSMACMAKGGLVPPGESFIAGDDPKGKGKENMEMITPMPHGTHVQPVSPKAVRKMKKRKCGLGAGATWMGDPAAIGQAQLGDRELQQKAALAQRSMPTAMQTGIPRANGLMGAALRRRPTMPQYGTDDGGFDAPPVSTASVNLGRPPMPSRGVRQSIYA